MYSLRRLPLLAVLEAGLLSVTYELPFTDPTRPNTFLMVWTLSFGAHLLRNAFGSGAGGQPLSISAGLISTRRIARSIWR